MDDEIWSRSEPDSPCVKLCTIHPEEGICIGCYRTLAEIAAWSAMAPGDRRKIMDELPARAPLLRRRRGGHGGRSGRRAAE
jgi:predicted Fe-S protein YdhL (DUF1289 family)